MTARLQLWATDHTSGKACSMNCNAVVDSCAIGVRRKVRHQLRTVRIVLLLLVCLGLLVGPHTRQARGQESLPRIAYLADNPRFSPACKSNPPDVLFSAFLEGLHSLGYKEGQNVTLVCRSAEGKYERLDALAAELGPRLITSTIR